MTIYLVDANLTGMMTVDFWYQLLQSFLVGAVWVTLTTIIAEKFGSKIGGFIGGLPSTVLIALLFIGLTQSPAAAARASVVIPLTMGVNGIFTLIYLMYIRRGLLNALGRAFTAWLVLAGLIAVSGIDQLWLTVTGWLVLLVFYLMIVEKFAHIPPHGKVEVIYTPLQVVSRGLFTGTLIAIAVLITKIGGPVLGGIFSVFPVIFTSNMVITYRSGGLEFSRAVVKTLVASAMINVGVYAVAVHFCYPSLGLLWGTVAAVVITLASAGGTLHFIRRYLK